MEVELKEKSPSAANRGAKKTQHNSIIHQNKKFLKTLFEPLQGFIEIREIKNSHSQAKFFNDVDDLLAEYQPPADKNVYVGMFTREKKRGRKQDIGQTQILWLDFDDVESLLRVDYLLEMKGIPKYTMAVNSGHGFHTYWQLEKPAGKEVAPVLRELARITGADMKAAEVARIMRLPGTMNVKGDPVKCELIEYTDNIYSLKQLADKLEVKPKADKEPQQVDEAIGIDYKGIISKTDRPCIRSMLEGVEAGQRNWILGRLTMYFRNVAGYSMDKTRKIIKAWNCRNEPPQNKNELMASFDKYWHTDYNLLGCRVLDKDEQPIRNKQQILNFYCNKDSCSRAGYYKVKEGDKASHYNNRIIKKIKEINATALVIYGVLEQHPEGLTAERATEIINISKKHFREKAKHLIDKGFISKKEGIKRRKIPDLYFVNRQGTYGTGRTAVNYGAVLLAANKVITPAQYKVYLLLAWYKYIGQNGRVNPSTFTLAEKLGVKRPTVQNHISALEKKDIIKIDRSTGQANKYDITFNLDRGFS